MADKSINVTRQLIFEISGEITNGDVIKSMFPNVRIDKLYGRVENKLTGYRMWFDAMPQYFSLEWWNSLYKEN